MEKITNQIDGVILKEFKINTDERGLLYEVLRNDDPIFTDYGFGQAYITVCNAGYAKGWHYHKEQFDRFTIINGTARVILFDYRPQSKTYGNINNIIIKESEAILLIPPGVIHGFAAEGDTPCSILNISSRVYNRENPDEYRFPLDSEIIPFTGWRHNKGW
jgi:dTDP-4-dehydrorhamnose 3,5-epimerase